MKFILLFFTVFSLNSFSSEKCPLHTYQLNKYDVSDLKKLQKLVGTYKLSGGDNCGTLKISEEEYCAGDEWEGTIINFDIIGKEDKNRRRVFYEINVIGPTGMEYFKKLYHVYRIKNLKYSYGYKPSTNLDLDMKKDLPVSLEYKIKSFLNTHESFICSISPRSTEHK